MTLGGSRDLGRCGRRDLRRAGEGATGGAAPGGGRRVAPGVGSQVSRWIQKLSEADSGRGSADHRRGAVRAQFAWQLCP